MQATTYKAHYTVTCDFCQDQAAMSPRQVTPTRTPEPPELPYGWRTINHMVCCAKHDIVVDDKPLGAWIGEMTRFCPLPTPPPWQEAR